MNDPDPNPNPRDATGETASLMSLVYDELRQIAGAYMQRERADHTLQPTALVNEAYVKLARSPACGAMSRAKLLGIAARAMRQVLVDHARGHNAGKRGGGWERVTLSGMGSDPDGADPIDVLALDTALTKLAGQDNRLADVVELRFFGGLTIDAAADVLGVSHTTVEKDWAFARAWLRRELAGYGS